MEDKSFARNLVKGRITETIFYLMFAEVGEYTITPFGYEHTIPALAQYQQTVDVKQVLDTIKKTPDFILMSQDKCKVFFVEVKFRAIRHAVDLLQIAEAIDTRWHPAWLFCASLDGFFYAPCRSIIGTKGEISPLTTTWIPKEIQQKYLSLLNEFLHPHS